MPSQRVHGSLGGRREEDHPSITITSSAAVPDFAAGMERGTFWCSLALNSPTALFTIFYDHIQPRFSKTHKDDEAFWLITVRYWTLDAFKFLETKVKDKEQYDVALREAFKS